MDAQASLQPSVFDYLDVVQLLQDQFEWRKRLDSRFSYTKWSVELGFNNKTILRLILKRKRAVSHRTREVFKSNLRLVGDEAKYFDALVAHSQASTAAERQAFAASLLKLQRQRYKQREIGPEAAVKSVIGPVILTLLTFKDLQGCDVVQLERLLGIARDEIQMVLNDFVSQGLIRVESGGVYSFNEAAFRIPAETPREDLQRFHAYWLERAKESMQLDFATRRLRSLKFALNEDEFAEAIERINEFALTILARFHRDELRGRRLYMLESALFPISAHVAHVDRAEVFATERGP